MSVQRLDRTLRAYRIGDPNGEFSIYDATGSERYPGRWNDAATPVIYGSEHYSTAMLEKLVHGAGLMPANQHYIEMTLPKGMSYEMVTKDALPGWDAEVPTSSRDYGVRWAQALRSCILLVPSLVARIEWNLVINPAHAEAAEIERSLPAPIWWDRQLFAAS